MKKVVHQMRQRRTTGTWGGGFVLGSLRQKGSFVVEVNGRWRVCGEGNFRMSVEHSGRSIVGKLLKIAKFQRRVHKRDNVAWGALG